MALITDKFTETTNGTRPVPTQLTAIRSVGAANISCAALTGWPTNTAVHFIIYAVDVDNEKIPGSQTDWKGIVVGNTITQLQLKAGTDLGDSVGAVVEAAPTAAWADDLVEGLVVEHKQDGTHGPVTADSLVVAGPTTLNGSANIVGDLTYKGATLEQLRADLGWDFVASGCLWTLTSGLSAEMSSGVVYINGIRLTVSAVAARAFTASKDTYVDITSAGVISYNEVANYAQPPALAANSVRLALVRTDATTATPIQTTAYQATGATSTIAYLIGQDSIGNWIYPTAETDRKRKLFAGFPTNATSGVTGTEVAHNLFNTGIINNGFYLKQNRRYKLKYFYQIDISSANCNVQCHFYLRSTRGAAFNTGTKVARMQNITGPLNQQVVAQGECWFTNTGADGVYYLGVAHTSAGSGTWNFYGSLNGSHAYIEITEI